MKVKAATKPASAKSKTKDVKEVQESQDAREQVVQELRLTKIKQWYFPVDLESYKTLKSIGVPLLRVQHDFMPTLRLILGPKNIKETEVSFQETILHPFIESILRTWKKKYGTCVADSHSISLIAKEPEKIAAAETAVSKLQNLVYDFFSRWGFAYSFDVSKSASGKRLKIYIDYKFDPHRLPILNLDSAVEAPPKVQLKLGLIRLTFTFDNPKGKIVVGRAAPGVERPPKYVEPGYVHTLVEISQGGRWTPFHSSKCNVTQISNVLPLVTALMDVRNQDPHNEDNSPE
jgi:hypothetical protein